LQLEGEPYPVVQLVVISPTFATDRTLFAYAWTVEPNPDGTPVPGNRRALFRSTDAGATWSPVGVPPGRGRFAFPRLALSPRFADDGRGLLTVNYSSGSPSSSNCAALRTEDHGASWITIGTIGPAIGVSIVCGDPHIWEVGEQLLLLRLQARLPRSLDGGRTWIEGPSLSLSTYSLSQSTLLPSPNIARDGTVFRLGDGVLGLGPGLQATNSRLPCPVEPAAALVPWLQSNPQLLRSLGCPVGPLHAVRISTAPIQGDLNRATGYFTEDDWPYWLEVYPEQASGGRLALPRPRAIARWLSAPDVEVKDGASQAFDDGVVLWLPTSAGTGRLLVVGNREWTEIPGVPNPLAGGCAASC
jgi:hypothetical protein